MGKPAAAVGDQAAHGGTITLGSPNVRIGGRPAARKGDAVTCPVHGPTGVIEQASTTVFINGKPAARMGDITMCLVPPAPPLPPAVLGPETSTSTVPVPVSMADPPAAGTPSTPPQVWSGSSEPTASDAPHWQNDLTQVPSSSHAEGIITDVNRDGQYDTYEGSAEFGRVRTSGYTDLPVFLPELGGTFGVDAAYASTRGSAPTISPKSLSLTGRAEAGLLKLGATGTLAPSGSNGANAIDSVGAEVNLLHANARGDVLAGDDGNRVGVVLKGEAGAEVVKGDAYERRVVPLPGGWSIELTGKGGAAAMAAGVGVGGWAFLDKEEDRFNIGALGKFEWGWGGRADLNLSIGRKTEPTPLPPTPTPPVVTVPGTILQGNPTVQVGG